jgi:16S rRNA (cytosine1402-N4)-methyltransferase
MSTYHIPVLLKESVDGLNIHSGGTYADVTFGGGGHSVEILSKLGKGKLFAFDQDDDAIKNMPDDKRFFFIQGNFRFLKNYLNFHGVNSIDGLLADLGVSSHHFNTPERGFTYRSEASLDMRMNQKSHLTAETVINDYENGRLTDIFREYGEIQQAKKLVHSIDFARKKARITTTSQFISCIGSLVPKQSENQFLSKVFQAIRIEVNRELDNLNDLLTASLEMLRPGGRLVIISYHSLEDRMVKNFMRWGNTAEAPFKDIYGRSSEPFALITRKPVVASDEEIRNNPRARSARLRIAEKKENP